MKKRSPLWVWIVAAIAAVLTAPWIIFAGMLTYACTVQNNCL